MIGAPERTVALGQPSYVRRSGQERPLGLIRGYASPEEGCILDAGHGIGSKGGSR